MQTKKPPVKKIAANKETVLKAVTEQLQTTLPVLKEQLGDKKFEKRIKKVAKILVAGIKKIPVKKSIPATTKVAPVKKKNTKVVKAAKVATKK